MKMTNKDRLSVLLICDKFRHGAYTIHDHIQAIANSKHRPYVLDTRPDFPNWVNINSYDVLIIHYTHVMCYESYISSEMRRAIKNFSGLKICFIQDEYRFVNDTVNIIKFLDIHVVFTCIQNSEIEKVYSPQILKSVRFVNVLTGYTPSYLLKMKTPPYESRPIDVCYRGREIPAWLGELGQEKMNIAKQFLKDAQRYQLKTDIEYHENARLYRNKWIQFLSNSKACLGVESGASVFDFDSQIERKVRAHLEKDPGASFKTLQSLYFKDHEGRIKLNQISPRCFEAAALKTLMILYEGEYSKILVPWRHYVPLKKDHSNMRDVVEAMRDASLAKKIISQAYQEISLNPCYSYIQLTKVLDEIIDEEFSKRNFQGQRMKEDRMLRMRLFIRPYLLKANTKVQNQKWRAKICYQRMLGVLFRVAKKPFRLLFLLRKYTARD